MMQQQLYKAQYQHNHRVLDWLQYLHTNMDVAAKKLQIRQHGRLPHQAAQIYNNL